MPLIVMGGEPGERVEWSISKPSSLLLLLVPWRAVSVTEPIASSDVGVGDDAAVVANGRLDVPAMTPDGPSE